MRQKICSLCDNRIIWKNEKYLCCLSCGIWTLVDDDYEVNNLIGDWNDEEMSSLDIALKYYGDVDFTFFKGKKVITAWQKDMPLSKMLVVNDFQELLNNLK